MRANEVRELFRLMTASYFDNASVILNNQSRIAKPELGLVVIGAGSARRPHMPNYSVSHDGVLIGNYPTQMTVTVDLFTHGAAVYTCGEIVGYEDSSVDDMLSFADYLNSVYVTTWCRINDISILIDGDVQCLTGIINDTTYEYRARMTVIVNFMQKAIEKASVLSEDSIRYPVYSINPETGEILRGEDGTPIIMTNPETGEALYTATPPMEMHSRSGGWETNAETIDKGKIIQPEFAQTSTGGGTEDLASKKNGYFIEVDKIKEEDFE